ncbi:MAG: MFS transporter [Chloroflexi bacterium]|nr:MFS transporter [Chloroflexota bacterium]
MGKINSTISGKRNTFYGWWILAGSVVAMALGSGVSFWSFGLYIEPLETEFGWSRTEVTLGFSVSLLVSGLTGPFVGRWVDARGPRSAIIVGATLTGATYLLLATTSELWQWYAYQSINAVFRQLMFFIPFQALISRWFDRRRGIALGILGTGFSLGGFVVVPLMRVVIDEYGWDGSFIFSGIVTVAVLVPMGLLLVRNSPADIGATVDGEPPARDGSHQPRVMTGLTLGQALRTPFFWVLSLAMMLFFYGVFGWLVHMVPFYESVGISRGVAAALVSGAAAFGILSRLAFGALADRIPRIEKAAIGLLAFLMAAMTALILDSGTAGIAVFLVFFIVGSGGGPLLEPLLLPRAFGLAHFGAILGTFAVIETIGLVASPAIAGAIFDSTGSYDWVLVMLLAAFAGSAVLLYIASRLPLPFTPQPEPMPAAGE